MLIYCCNKKVLQPPEGFIKCNLSDEYKTHIEVDDCIADEVEELWNRGIKTTGCCCGHGAALGMIQVREECIPAMEQMGYVHYIYETNFGGVKRKDAFIPKSYGHRYNGYSDGYIG